VCERVFQREYALCVCLYAAPTHPPPPPPPRALFLCARITLSLPFSFSPPLLSVTSCGMTHFFCVSISSKLYPAHYGIEQTTRICVRDQQDFVNCNILRHIFLLLGLYIISSCVFTLQHRANDTKLCVRSTLLYTLIF